MYSLKYRLSVDSLFDIFLIDSFVLDEKRQHSSALTWDSDFLLLFFYFYYYIEIRTLIFSKKNFECHLNVIKIVQSHETQELHSH